MKQQKTLKYYQKLLPKELTVQIHKAEEGGFWAKIKELPNCYTQAENFKELVDMVNDAVFTYLEIPKKFQTKLSFYLPKEIVEELNRRKWEDFLNKILNKEPLKEKTQIFAIP